MDLKKKKKVVGGRNILREVSNVLNCEAIYWFQMSLDVMHIFNNVSFLMHLLHDPKEVSRLDIRVLFRGKSKRKEITNLIPTTRQFTAVQPHYMLFPPLNTNV